MNKLYKWLIKIGICKAPEPKTVLEFMQQSKRFENVPDTNDRHWKLLDKDGRLIGAVWFKHLLGGWRLRLASDIRNEWESRGPLNTIDKLKAYL